MSVSLQEALDAVLFYREKQAVISTSPNSFFVHIRIPAHVAEQLRSVQEKVVPNEDQRVDPDHVTLVYTSKPEDAHPPERVHAALEALRVIGERTEPIEAKIQGYAYFDAASKDGKPATALVALIDAPMLQHLHVDMSRALEDHGIEPSNKHGFVSHATLAYLPQFERVVGELPPLSSKFTIDRAHVASRDVHEIPLTGHENVGRKAAALAYQREVSLGEAAAKHAVDYNPADNFTLSPSALRQDHRQAPGKGETSAVVGTATPQTGAMHSGGGFK